MDDVQELASWAEIMPIGGLLLHSFAEHPDRDALVFPGERYTFGGCDSNCYLPHA